MNAALRSKTSLRPPLWLLATAFAGLAWNAFGAVQFIGSLTATPQSLMDSGLTAAQATVMTSYPAWMTLAFGIGVLGGLIGSGLLALRHRLARPVFAVSLAAYVALWVGDAVYGVFTALGLSQIIILTLVVAIAAGLYAVSRMAGAQMSNPL